MKWLDKILGRNNSVEKEVVGHEAADMGKVSKESSQTEEAKAAERPVTTILRDDDVFFISKTAYQKSKNRGYEIMNKEDGVKYVMDIQHGDKNILINLVASKDGIAKTFSRGAKVENNPEGLYAVECNFLSTLKLKKNMDGNLIGSLLVLTGDEICDAPKKRKNAKERDRAARMEAEFVKMHGMSSQEWAAKERKEQQLREEAFVKEHSMSSQEWAAKERKEQQLREEAFVKEHGMSSQEWAAKERQCAESTISASSNKILKMAAVLKNRGKQA